MHQYTIQSFDLSKFLSELTPEMRAKVSACSFKDDSLVVYTIEEMEFTVAEVTALDAVVAAHDGIQDPVDKEKINTEAKMREGFEMYQKIFAHITVNDPIASIDNFLSIYPAISLLRMLLKDAMFESALRFMATKTEIGGFNSLALYQAWVRELAKKHNPALNDQIIAAIEGAPEGQV